MPALTLTDALLRSAAPGEKLIELWDSRVAGLCLRISPGGARTWTFRYRPKDSASFKRLGLGRYPEIGLALARQRAQEARVGVSGGADPQGERRAKREAERSALIFDALADAYLERYAKPRKRSWENDALYLRVHVRPAWGSRPANRITRADAAGLLDNIAKTAPTSANRTQSILSRLFNWSIESGLLEVNPLARMPKRAKETAKDRVLSRGELRALWQALDGGGPVTAALRLALLTGLRPIEIAGLAIGEVADVDDAARARLEIPASRMKGGRAHVHPLAPMAAAIVREQVERAVEGQEHVFASEFEGRGPIARHSLSQGLHRIIEGLTADSIRRPYPTPHDFRRSVATGLAALGVPREDRLALLAHAQDDVHGIHYDKYDRLAEKRRALEVWEADVADVIGLAPAKTDNVVKLGRARR
jgi:integrase